MQLADRRQPIALALEVGHQARVAGICGGDVMAQRLKARPSESYDAMMLCAGQEHLGWPNRLDAAKS